MNTYQLFPALSDAEYQELKDDIAERGVQVPVEYDDSGNVLDGHHRKRACDELGITQFPSVVRYGMSEAEKRNHVRKLNLARRHMNQAAKRQVIADALKEQPDKSDRQHAEALGVSDKTVGAVRGELESIAEIPQCETRGCKDGRAYPAKKKPAAKQQPGAPALFVTLEKDLERALAPAVVQRAAETGVARLSSVHVENNSGNNEWYTPEKYINAARAVLGSIDLDPASCKEANRVVQATRFFSAEDDGLSKTWHGKVWMNPPYCGKLVPQFCDKLIESVSAGSVTDAVVLVNNATETRWFQSLLAIADSICLLGGRVQFWSSSDCPDAKSPLQGQAVLYVGSNRAGFIAEFQKLGVCCVVQK